MSDSSNLNSDYILKPAKEDQQNLVCIASDDPQIFPELEEIKLNTDINPFESEVLNIEDFQIDFAQSKQLIDELLDYYGEPSTNEADSCGTHEIVAVEHKNPLHLAVMKKDFDTLVELLSNPDTNIDAKDKYDATALHLAALTNQPEMIKVLLENGADPNIGCFKKQTCCCFKQDYGLTAMELAISENHLESVLSLSQNGVKFTKIDIIKAFEIFTSNCIAPNIGHDITKSIEIIKTIIKASEHKYLTEHGQTISYYTLINFAASCATTKEIHDQIMDIANDLELYDTTHQAIMDAKNLFHLIPIRGTFKININTETKISIQAEGHYPFHTSDLVQESVENYLDTLDINSREYLVFNEISDAIDFEVLLADNHGQKEYAELALARFNEGQLTILPTGWEGHFVTITLNPENNTIIFGNNGDRYHKIEAGARIFEINNLDNLTADLIYKILNNTSDFDLQLKLEAQLGLVEIDSISQPNQTTGNCAWQSHEPAIEGIIFQKLISFGESVETAKQLANDWYTKWDNFQTQDFLESYLNDSPKIDAHGLCELLAQGHKTLFGSVDKDLDPAQLARADLIVKAMASDQFTDVITPVMKNNLLWSAPKPELKAIFEKYQLPLIGKNESKPQSDEIDIFDLIFDSKDNDLDNKLNEFKVADNLDQHNNFGAEYTQHHQHDELPEIATVSEHFG